MSSAQAQKNKRVAGYRFKNLLAKNKKTLDIWNER